MRYVCPKCNSKYCSLACYKTHSVQCTEIFYRECVSQSLKGRQASPEEQRQLIELLKRMRNLEDDSMSMEMALLGEKNGQELDDDPESIQGDLEFLDNLDKDELFTLHRLANLNVANLESFVPSKWLAEFDAEIQGGNALPFLTSWTPWWLRIHLKAPIIDIVTPSPESKRDELENRADKESQKDENDQSQWGVNEMEEDSSVLEASSVPSPAPEILDNVPNILSLSKTPVSQRIIYNIVNILYSYVYVKLLYNGDWEEELEIEVKQIILILSRVLSADHVFSSSQDACYDSIQAAMQSTLAKTTRQFSIAVIEDVLLILKRGNLFVQASLSDLFRFFSRTSKIDLTKIEATREVRRMSRRVTRKLLFMISWCQHMGQFDKGDKEGTNWRNIVNSSNDKQGSDAFIEVYKQVAQAKVWLKSIEGETEIPLDLDRSLLNQILVDDKRPGH